MRPWTDTSLPIAERVKSLLGEMTPDEKLAQLGSAWVGANLGSGNVAPLQEAFGDPLTLEQASADGLGHLTRPLGTQPIDPVEGARRLAALQQDIVERTRLGVPAIAHDECLTGFTTFRATVFPTALAWAATFDPALVERMTRAIGESMHAVGVHQGPSPVLDVVRDYRWGRVEETLGEDPYLVGVIGTAYVRGLESAGVVATLKHFAGYSASQAARNHAPVAVGPRTLRDVLLLPFEMALREGGARSVMNSYSEIDGLPVGADAGLLTGVLRDEWGFEGVVVSDYWAIAFLQLMHRVAGTPAEAGALALEAGIDVELPHVSCYRGLAGAVPDELLDRAARRVLRQKAELGLLDADWSPESPAMAGDTLDIDPPEHRAIAREQTMLFSLANVATWAYTDYNMIILYAALRSIPTELYEAAAVDGAGPVSTAWHIKLPLLRPALLLCTIFSVIGSFQLFGEPRIFYALAPDVIGKDYTPNLYVYNLAFADQRLNYAAALSFLLGAVVFVISYVVMYSSRRQEAAR